TPSSSGSVIALGQRVRDTRPLPGALRLRARPAGQPAPGVRPATASAGPLCRPTLRHPRSLVETPAPPSSTPLPVVWACATSAGVILVWETTWLGRRTCHPTESGAGANWDPPQAWPSPLV